MAAMAACACGNKAVGPGAKRRSFLSMRVRVQDTAIKGGRGDKPRGQAAKGGRQSVNGTGGGGEPTAARTRQAAAPRREGRSYWRKRRLISTAAGGRMVATRKLAATCSLRPMPTSAVVVPARANYSANSTGVSASGRNAPR